MALIGWDRAEHATLLPVALTLLGGLGWAFGNVGSRLPAAPNPLHLTLWMTVVAPLPMLALSAVDRRSDRRMARARRRVRAARVAGARRPGLHRGVRDDRRLGDLVHTAQPLSRRSGGALLAARPGGRDHGVLAGAARAAERDNDSRRRGRHLRRVRGDRVRLIPASVRSGRIVARRFDKDLARVVEPVDARALSRVDVSGGYHRVRERGPAVVRHWPALWPASLWWAGQAKVRLSMSVAPPSAHSRTWWASAW